LISIIKAIEDILTQAANQTKAATDAKQIDAAVIKLATIKDKAKAAQDKSKKLDSEFDADLDAMSEYSAELEVVRNERDTIAGLPGAKAQLDEIEKLMQDAQSKITTKNGLARGYPAALAALKDHGKILERAQEASQKHVEQQVPAAVKQNLFAARKYL